MKNIIKKKNWLKKPITYVLLFIILIFSSCKKDDTPTDCGCNSETLRTIPNLEIQIPIEEQKRGLLFYKHLGDTDSFYDGDEYNNRFWIFQNSPCNSCRSHLIICNEEILGMEYDYLKQNGIYDSIPIQFSGNVKKTCKGLIALPTNYSYNEFILSSIENQ